MRAKYRPLILMCRNEVRGGAGGFTGKGGEGDGEAGGGGGADIERAGDGPEVPVGAGGAEGVGEFDEVMAATVPGGGAGGDGAGGVAGGEAAAVGDVYFAIDASAFCEGAEVDV